MNNKIINSLSTVILLMGMFSVSAGSAQTQPSVKIDRDRVTINVEVTKEILDEIKKEVGGTKDLDITLTGIKTNDDIAKICDAYPDMKALNIRAEKEVTSVAPLAKLKSVTKLRVTGKSISDLTPVSGLTQLTDLYVDGDFADLKWMSRLTNLSSLELQGQQSSPGGGTKLVSFEGIPALPKLTRLRFQGAAPKSLEPLKVLSETLKDLTLFWCDITDLTPLTSLAKLEKLSLYGSGIKDFSPLAGCPALKELNFYATKGSDYKTLGKITQLEVLEGGLTDLDDISWITSLTKLKNYRMFAESVKDYTPLAKLQLEELMIWQMKVRPIDLGFLKDMTSMKKLVLKEVDGATNAKTIETLTYLTELEMTKFNNKTDGGEAIPLDVIKKLPNLTRLTLTKGVFTDGQLQGFSNANIRISQF